MDDIGAYEAKTHLPRLLGMVAAGSSVTITKHGHPVARLVPVDAPSADTPSVIAALRDARRGLTRGDTTVRQMIEEGRNR